MRTDVKADLAKLLDCYEITNIGILSVNANSTENIESNETQGNSDDDDEFPEGKALTRLHKHKERNPKVTRAKKRKVLQESGKLECEVCGFDFAKTYGQLGYGFAECHHTIPVAELTESHKTKLADLAIVCANCHRMLHKARPLINVNELQEIMADTSHIS